MEVRHDLAGIGAAVGDHAESIGGESLLLRDDRDLAEEVPQQPMWSASKWAGRSRMHWPSEPACPTVLALVPIHESP